MVRCFTWLLLLNYSVFRCMLILCRVFGICSVYLCTLGWLFLLHRVEPLCTLDPARLQELWTSPQPTDVFSEQMEQSVVSFWLDNQITVKPITESRLAMMKAKYSSNL